MSFCDLEFYSTIIAYFVGVDGVTYEDENGGDSDSRLKRGASEAANLKEDETPRTPHWTDPWSKAWTMAPCKDHSQA